MSYTTTCTIEDVYKYYSEKPEKIGGIEVKTRFGYEKIEFCDITSYDSDVYLVVLENGYSIKCSPDHLLLKNNEWCKCKELIEGESVLTDNGYVKVKSITKLPYKDDLYDFQVANVKEYYSDGIVSHNSTMLSTLTYCLYGKMLAGIKLNQAINAINKKNLLTTCIFEANGEEWTVVRGEKPKKFEIYRNDELVDQYANARDQQKFLEVILGMDFKLFVQVVVINKERYIPFMEMAAAERRKIIEDILGISVFSYMNEVTKQRIKSLQQDEANLDRDRQVQMKELEGQQKLINEVQNSIKAASESVKQEVEEKQSKIKELKEQFHTITNEMNEISLDGHEKVKNQIKEFEALADEFSRQITESKKLAKFFQENNHCPTCGQDIDEELKVQKANESDDKCIEVQTIIGEMMQDLEEVAAKNKEFEKKSERWSKLSQEQQTTMFQISSLESDVKHILDRSASSSNKEKLETYINTYEDMESRLESLSDDLRAVIETRELHERMRELLKDDGIKASIVKEYNTIINKLINEYLNAMQFYVNMTIDENFNETFHAMNREGFTYSNLSTGQKTRVNIAITLALLEVASIKNSVSTNILCLDELLEPIDAEGIKDVMGLFKEKLSTKNIFVVSQRFDEFEDQFQSAIRFTINQGFTEMVV